MLDVYDHLKFDNPNGGVWKQGFEIKYDKAAIQREKRLEIVVVPHSHCDPGWIKTFDQYFADQTRAILDNALKFLTENSEMRFIYAEISFFERWWSQISDEKRKQMRKCV